MSPGLGVLAALPLLIGATLSVAGGGDSEPVGPSPRGWRTLSGEAVPDSAWRKSSGPFCAELLLTKDLGLIERWEKPAEIVEIRRAHEIRRGDWLLVAVLFANIDAGPSGQGALRIDYSIEYPDGKPPVAVHDAPGWGVEPPPANMLELGQRYLRWHFDNESPLGTYRVEAFVRDEASGKRLHVTRSFELLDSPPAAVDETCRPPGDCI